MKHIVLLLLTIGLTTGTAQDIKLNYEYHENDVVVLAHNPHPCPVSIEVRFTLVNMRCSKSSNIINMLLPVSDVPQRVATLSSIDPYKDGSYHTDYKTFYGDVTQSTYDHDYIYSLPTRIGKPVTIHQGYDGTYSHKGVKALDFSLKVGSKIYAARGGVVIKKEDRNNKGCKSPACHKYNNMIVVYHDDGTLGIYSHLKQNGAIVNVGDRIEKGQHIAYSGATGYVSGPHLHFMVILPRHGDNKSIPTYFETQNFEKTYLKEGWTYTGI